MGDRVGRVMTWYDCPHWEWIHCRIDPRHHPCNPSDCPVDFGRHDGWRAVVAQLPALDCACRAEIAATRRAYAGRRIRQASLNVKLCTVVTGWWDQYLTLLEAAGWEPWNDPEGWLS